MARARVTTLVAHTVRSSRVVAARDLANPIGGIAGHMRDGGRGESTRQEPEEVPSTAFDGVMGLAIPLMQLVVSQVGMEVDVSWHAPVLQQLRVTWYQAYGHIPNVLCSDRDPPASDENIPETPNGSDS